jgi:hypothetical protein
MTHRHILGASALALVLAAPAAFALTPEEAWTNWQAMYAASGGTFTAASTAMNGPTLEISGLTVTQEIADTDGIVTVTMDKMSFTDRGDGSVDIKFSDTLPITISVVEGPGEKPVLIGLDVSQPGMSLVAAGTVEDTTYSYAAPAFSATLTSLVLPDGSSPTVSGQLSGTEVAGEYLVTKAGETTTVKSSGTVGGLSVTADGVDPDTNDPISVKLSVSDVTTATEGVMLGSEVMKDMAAALKAGFTMDTSMTAGAISLLVEGQDRGQPVTISTSFTGADFALALDAERVGYGFGLMGAAIDMTVPDLPVPVRAGWGEAAFRVALPLAQTTEPQDFTALLRLVDVTMDESLWSMADPGRALSRDPVTLILDLSGGMAWTVDIMVPGALESAAMPINLHSLNLTEVLARAFGAEVTATGALTFDNSDLMTFGGIPAPEGKITVNMKGINALIETLVSMGLLPEDQVMGARMMLAMFAKPGAGADELISEIEFKDKGLFVNGQQLQ